MRGRRSWQVSGRNMILGIQLIGIMFTVFMVYLTFLSYKQNKISKPEWIIWLGIWVTFITITLFPSILNPVLETLNLYRAMDLYISLGFLFFIIVIFNLYTSLRSTQIKMETIIRELANKNVAIPIYRKVAIPPRKRRK